jgi:PAS domain S-box-containing protein
LPFVYSTMDDIKQKLADLKLKLVHGERNVLMEKIIDQAPCIIAEMETGLIVFASKRINDVFGYIYNEIEGKKVTDLMPADLKSRHDAHLANYSKMPKFRNMGAEGMVLKGRRKDGKEINIKISLEPFIEDMSGFVLATILEV